MDRISSAQESKTMCLKIQLLEKEGKWLRRKLSHVMFIVNGVVVGDIGV